MATTWTTADPDADQPVDQGQGDQGQGGQGGQDQTWTTADPDAGRSMAPATAPVSAKGLGEQVITGLEAVPYRIAGAPADIYRGVTNLERRAFGMPLPKNPVPGGYEWLTSKAGQVHRALNPENFPARNLPERLVRSSAEAAGSAMAAGPIGEAAEAALPASTATQVPSSVRLTRILSGSEGTRTPGGMLATGVSAAGAGAGAEAGGEYATSAMTPEFRRTHPALAAIIAQGGTMLGGGAGGLLARGVPYVGGSIAQDITGSPERDLAIERGKRLGVQVPEYMVGSPLMQRIGQIGTSVPWAGAPLERAPEKMMEQMQTAAEREAGAIGTGDPTGKTAGEIVGGDVGSRPGVTPAVPPTGLRGWTKRISQNIVGQGYTDVNQALTNPGALTQLDGLRRMAQTITADRDGQNLQDTTGNAVRFVSRALMDQRGMTYENIKGLRTRLGQMLDDPSLMPQDADPTEMSRLYGALTGDLRNAASNAGGARGLAAFDAANAQAAQVAANRTQLVKFLGGSAGNATDEEVFKHLTRAGQESGDLDALRLARSKVDPNDWNELASNLMAKMASQGEDGKFSFNKLASAYDKFTDGGKDEIFGKLNDADPSRANTRQAMEDLNGLSQQAKNLYSKYANVSKTGHTVVGLELLKNLVHDPLHTIATVVPARILANALAKPATSGPIRAFIHNRFGYAMAPSEETMRAMKYSAARVSSAMAANFGANINPDLLVNTDSSGQ